MAEIDEERRRELINNKLCELKITMKPKEKEDLVRYSSGTIALYFDKVEKIQKYMKAYNIYLSDDDISKLAKNSWASIEAFFLKNKTAGPLVEEDKDEEDIDEVYHYSRKELDMMFPPVDGIPLDFPPGFMKDNYGGPTEEDSYNRGRRR